MNTLASTVSTRELRANLADVLGRVSYGGERIGVTKNGHLTAVVIGIEDLQTLEELEDARDLATRRLTMYRVEFTSAAARQVRKLDRPVRTRLLNAIESLAYSPRPDGVKKLASTENAWHICVGDYRVIYSIEDDVLVVTVVRVAHRREVYHS